LTVVPIPVVHATEETRRSVVALLESCLEDARAGKIDTVVIVAHYLDGMPWRNSASSTPSLSEALGQMEIMKHRWIAGSGRS